MTPPRAAALPAPDPLADALLASLSRPTAGYECIHPARSLIAAVLTFGTYPLLDWPRRWNYFAATEQQQLWHLAQWLRLNTPHAAAGRLPAIARRIRLPRVARAVRALCLLALLFGLLWHHADRWQTLLASTYGYLYRWPAAATPAPGLYVAWSVLLGVGYGAHWLSIHRHAARVRRFIEQFNQIAPREDVMRVVPETAGHGLNAKWVLIAGVLLALGALWAIPMAAAGAAQQKYRDRASRNNRAALADRLRQMLLAVRPALDVPELTGLSLVCSRNNCRAKFPAGTRFCPRCGLAVKSTRAT